MIAEVTRPIAAPREAVIASAGSGKTFRISSRIIGLLAQGAPVESILGSTFTRKAAGQILEAVLERLAEASLSPAKAEELAHHASLGPGHVLPEEPAFWAEQLETLVRALHRTSLGTLDSFFVGIARVFAHELGLPTGWSIADEPTAEELRSDVLQELLAAAEPDEMAEMLSLMNKGEARRSIHEHLVQLSSGLLQIHDDLDPNAENPWGWMAKGEQPPPPDQTVLEALARTISELPVPCAKNGNPRRYWSGSLGKLPGMVTAADWEGFLGNGLVQKVLDGEDKYDWEDISPECREAIERVVALAAVVMRWQHALRLQALGRLSSDFATAFREAQFRNGVYGFQDITRLLADGGDVLDNRADLYFRLDARVRHLLLDEFQDTSLAQWQALEPLAAEVLSEPGERAAVIVADPKQSIYGWRGGEPAIVHHVEEHYRLSRQSLAESWRSSQVLLDFVNLLFDGLGQLPTVTKEPVWAETVERWSRDFEPHRSAKPLADRPGHIEVSVGPRESSRAKNAEPVMCRHAAERVAEIHRTTPGASIGVLVGTNATVARMIVELKQQGIQASEEGGMPLTNAASCEAILALLHLADHPGDTVARYHVAHSPLGKAVDLAEDAQGSTVRVVAQRVRTWLAEDGYGRTIDRWAEALRSSCDRREWRRLMQLAEMAHAADERAPLRPTDFVRLVESQRVEDPSTAPVRVMTVHQSKGLQFDVVVLPELDRGLASVGNSTLRVTAHRTGPTARATAAVPLLSKIHKPLFPELAEPNSAAEASRLRDDISSLYVALTRARHALYAILRADGNSVSQAKTSARLIRETLAEVPEKPDRISEGEILFEDGDPDWHLQVNAGSTDRAPTHEVDPERIRLARPPARRRLLPRRSPSSLEAGSTVPASSVLRIDSRPALMRGSIIHAWCEEVAWIEDGLPANDVLRSAAHAVGPDLEESEVERLIESFRQSLDHSEIRAALSRAGYPDEVELRREEPFLHREKGVLVEGIIDRLMIFRENGKVRRAEILDFKTDALSDDPAALKARVDFHRPQMQAYIRAVAGMLRLPPEAVSAKLLFLETGNVVSVEG